MNKRENIKREIGKVLPFGEDLGGASILIIGAGLCGSLLALRLAQRGYKVELYESRPDLRKVDISAGRSINLALSDRGLKALRLCGMEEKAREICIPMYGRLMHDTKGNTFTSNYSGRENEYINSISRGDLNAILLDEAEKHKNVKIHFNSGCKKVDIENKIAHFKSYETGDKFKVKADVIFGTDGAGIGADSIYYWDDVMFVSGGGGVLTQVDLPITFEDTATVDYALTDFGGNYSELVADPAGGTNIVAKSTKAISSMTWAGTTAGGNGLASAIPFAMGETQM